MLMTSMGAFLQFCLHSHVPSVHVQAADDAANGLAVSLLAEVPVGTELTFVALFIDEESAQARFLLA